jgi:arylsulfatase A-like enzyme
MEVYDDTPIILTADHGEEFMEHGWIGHTVSLYDTLLRVPLIVRPARFEGSARLVEGAVSLVSIAPTILDFVGLDRGAAAYEGGSLRGAMATGSAAEGPPLFAEVSFREFEISSANKRAVIAHPFKLIWDAVSKKIELYDVTTDSAERHNLALKLPAVTRKLRAVLASRSRQTQAAGEPTTELPEEMRRSLRELGYLD